MSSSPKPAGQGTLTQLTKADIAVAVSLTAASICALSFPFVEQVCSQCQVATKLEPIPWLNLIGATYYLLVCWSFFEFKRSRWAASAIYLAVGVHLVLLLILLNHRLFCVPCCLCATFVTIAALSLLRRFSLKLTVTAVVCGAVLCGGSFAGQRYYTRLVVENNTKKIVHFSKWPAQQHGPLQIAVYAWDKCPKCRAFKSTTLKTAEKRFGKSINIELREAKVGMMVPTVVVGGRHPEILIGSEPCSEDLIPTIDQNLAKLTALSSKSGIH